MALKLSHVTKIYTTAEGKLTVLNDLTCDFTQDKIHVVLGPSGAGKTTLLTIIAGLVKPTSGKVFLDDKELTDVSTEIGVIFQDLRLFPWLKVKDNVAFGLNLNKSSDIKSKVDKVLSAVGLQDFAEYYPTKLSGGMKQRLALARSLVLEPKILLMDEPFGSLDVITRHKLHDLLLEIRRSLHTTVLFVTHDIEEAVVLGDVIYILSGVSGKLTKVYDRATNVEQDTIKIKTVLLEKLAEYAPSNI